MIIPAVGNVYGGPSKCVFELAQCLGNLDVAIDIITTNANGDTDLEVPLCNWINEVNYRIQYFPYVSFGDYKFSWLMTRWLFNRVTDYDVVQTNAIFSLTNIPAYWACQWLKVPYIMTPHGMLEPWALSYKAWKKRLFYQLLEKPALNKAQAIQVLASPEAENIKKLRVKSSLNVVPNGICSQDINKSIDKEIFYRQYPHTRDKNLIIFLGRIDPKKGLNLLARAFAKVRNLDPKSHLVIAGPDNIGFLPTVKGYFEAVNCQDAVTFTGMLTGDIKYAALNAANIYVAPSYSEGFSMSILEGMASGLPCIITTGCNFPEAAAAKAAYIVDVDVEEIAQALAICMQNPQEAKAMGDRARELILNNYTWDKIAVKMVATYEAILNDAEINSPTLAYQE